MLSRDRTVLLALGVILTVGFLLRLAAADRLSPHVDEASSILAAHAVAAHGVPILPSGTVYFQGAPLSYVLAPFVWLGGADLQHLTAMRLISVAAGVATILLSYRLGRYVTNDPRVGVIMALLVALDPVSVQWSGHVRMYGLLQALTFGLAWAFIHQLNGLTSWRRASLVVALFWVAVFTHIGATLLWPAMGLAAMVVFRRSLARQLTLLLTLLLSAAAPVTLLWLNQVLGTASVSAGDVSSEPALSFVGDNLVAPLARFRTSASEWDWIALTRATTLSWLIPGLIVALSTIVAVLYVRGGNQRKLPVATQRAAIVLLLFYWLPVIAVGVFTISPKERYLLHVHLLGYVFVALVIVHFLPRWARTSGWTRRMVAVGSLAVMLAVVTANGAGVAWRLENSVIHPDYNAAMKYVAEHHEPGQPVIVALPAVAYLALDREDRNDMYFLAGPEDRPRAQRYTRRTQGGDLIDYWAGVDSIVTSTRLQQLLEDYPDAWIVVDRQRLYADWAPYAGAMTDVLDAMTELEYEAPGGALVLRPEAAIADGWEDSSQASDYLPIGPDYAERWRQANPGRVERSNPGTPPESRA